MANEKRLIDANALRKRMFSYYGCVDENSSKEYYRGETLMNYEVADLIEDCIDDAPTVDAVVVPPVKIGDTAYFIINKKIYEAEICLISWSQFHKTGIINELRGEVQKGHTVSARFGDWGKTVFATKEEAERVLYPCEYCFCGTYRSCEGCSYGERKDND